jgi:hypothetical protein
MRAVIKRPEIDVVRSEEQRERVILVVGRNRPVHPGAGQIQDHRAFAVSKG